ncbi:MAG: pyruvate kinase [Rickettsiales bacterium]|nr:pyruvate kinase [Rickettsiales bacterium]OUV79421.1 MAG: pyruvate kinase [Rickettsiales bacterium TMED131]|tara:strand:+ start:2428 stop:3843 length:1416 start_codon:yes stop_codon:yes gene_type:complete
MKRTKIVATIGPKTANANMLKKMYSAGMSLARLNGSHNSLKWHDETIKLIRKEIPNCPILLDIPGKKIRTIRLSYEPVFNKKDVIILTTKKGFMGKDKISITNTQLHKFLSKGNIVYADDGTLKFKVVKIINRDIYIRAENSGQLKSSKGINVPYVDIGTKLITDRDKKMIGFSKKAGVDFVGISFVESAKHVELIRKLINKKIPKIVSKIENQKGLDRLTEIVKASDVIMIDRGDLSTETNIETLGINQKNIIRVANNFAKPVIVATEMLDSMIHNPNPTKAEVLDISNSVLDGATATMLSGETAIGNYPIESIKVMSKVASVMLTEQDKKQRKNKLTTNEVSGMANAIKNLSLSLPITKIIAITISGFASRIISSQMLPHPIIAVSNNKSLARTFNMYSGTKGVYYETKFHKDSLKHIPDCLNFLWKNKDINKKDMILVIALGYPGSGRRMNTLQTHYVKDLIKTLSWK